MNRTDAYVAIGALAWLAGTYFIGEGHKARAAAMDRQTTAATYCSLQYASMHGGDAVISDCKAISKAHRERYR
jgi:hypothetical protein